MSTPNQIILGDSFDVLQTLPAESFHACVTDPPYGIRFMGKAWDGADIAARTRTRYRSAADADERAGVNGAHNSIAAEAGKYNLSLTANREFQEWTRAWGAEVYRVLKPGAHLVVFASTRTYHRMVCGLEDAGFEIRDQLAWVFGSGFPKSSNQEGKWEGWGTALKPAYEPIVLARKPLIGTVPENLAAHGTGALNINGCRIEATGESHIRINEPSQDRRYTDSGSTNFAAKPGVRGGDPLGRWPANLMHDGSPEVLDEFPAEAGGAAPASGNTLRTGNDSVARGRFNGLSPDRVPSFYGDSGNAARFFYCPKASAEDREAGLEFAQLKPLAYGNQAQAEVRRGNTEHEGNSGLNTVKMRANTHPTVKPTELMRWLCRLVTPPGGRILDPFLGSGSTGRGAVLEGFSFTGIEKEPEYGPIARARIIEAAGEMFANVELVDGRKKEAA